MKSPIPESGGIFRFNGFGLCGIGGRGWKARRRAVKFRIEAPKDFVEKNLNSYQEESGQLEGQLGSALVGSDLQYVVQALFRL